MHVTLVPCERGTSFFLLFLKKEREFRGDHGRLLRNNSLQGLDKNKFDSDTKLKLLSD
jgi:hypothetical protein